VPSTSIRPRRYRRGWGHPAVWRLGCRRAGDRWEARGVAAPCPRPGPSRRVSCAWHGPQSRSRLSRAVSCTSVHGLRWSCWIWRVCEHRELVHHGEVQSKAMRCAAVGPRPRWVTLTTSTPFVITSLRIASPKRLRAIRAGTAPTPAISHSSSPSVRPRTTASRSTLNSARKVGLGLGVVSDR
jgi:hypothetical protein